MARGSDPDSRPISVAELMARAKEQGATDVADAAASSPAATGRRHRGGKGAVSVAELTGEIPRIGDKATTPPPTRDFNAADVAERTATDRSDAEATATVDAETTATVDAEAATTADADPAPQSTAPSDQDTAAQRRIDYAGQETKAESKPASNAEPEADPSPADDQHSDEETTGVIASVQAYSQVDDNPEEDHRALSAAEREREFERYRNFEDVDETPAPASEPKKRKRGLFGRGRKDTAAQAAASADAAPDYPDNTDHEVTQLIPMVTAPQPPTTAPEGHEAPVPVPVEIAESEPVPSPPPATPPADSGRYLRFDIDDNDDDASAPAARDDDSTSTSETAKVDIAKAGPSQPDNLAYSAVDEDDSRATVATPMSAAPAQDTAAVRTQLTESAAARSEIEREPAVGESHETSPSVQWLLLIGQVLAGLAVGVALFWGFTELWRWNVYFALVLAVAVIFGLVTLVHVVRRSQDLISTLLALGVGLLVTIGPLVLLLVAGD